MTAAPSARRTDFSLASFIVRPHHTALSVENWEEARAFFVDVLGFKVLGEMAERGEPELAEVVGMPGARGRWAMLELGGYHIELFKWLEPKGRRLQPRQCDIGWAHICFQVSDVEEVFRRVTGAGWRALSAVKSLRGGRARVFYCEGPEGAVIEFVDYPQGH